MSNDSARANRRHVHTRAIRVDAYVRDDGLWDLEAVLVDTKLRDFALATGIRKAGEPVHEMRVTLRIDTQLNVVDAQARSDATPYPGHCETIAPDYRKLIGLNLMHDFRRHVRERLGGTGGCSHLTELVNVLPTAAIQAFAGEVFKPRDAAHDEREPAQDKPWQLDRCHALRSDGPAVARYYPRWYRAQHKTQQSND
jgi:hypothetical protein